MDDVEVEMVGEFFETRDEVDVEDGKESTNGESVKVG